MRKFFVLLFITSVFGSANAQKWSLSYNLPAGSIPFSVESIDDLVLVPTSSGVFRSDDGGATWAKNTDTVMYDISCYDKNNCFACGDGGMVYKTTNGGVTWVATATKPHPTKKLVDVKAISPTKVLVDAVSGVMAWSNIDLDTIYYYDSLYLTTDGGNTWVKTDVPTSNAFDDSKTRYVYSDSLVFTRVTGSLDVWGTNDLGVNMFNTHLSYQNGSRYVQTDMVSTKKGFLMAITDGSAKDPSVVIYKTSDGGNSFIYVFSSLGSFENTKGFSTGVSCMDFITETEGWLVGDFTQKADIYKSINGGKQWVRDTMGFENTGANGFALKLYMQNLNYGWGMDRTTQKIVKYDSIGASSGPGTGTGIVPAKRAEAVIYPNPSADGIFKIVNWETIQAQTLSVFDINGRLITTPNDKGVIDLTNQKQGIYVVVIDDGKGNKTYQKLIKQ
jgi:photosystem II stability/assembly factor-like uncharacterized protein